MPIRHYKYGKYSTRYPYRNKAGQLIGYTVRFNLENGDKKVIPLTYCKNGKGQQWRWQSFDKPRPMYGLEKLSARPNIQAFVFEGEKSTDVAQKTLPFAVCVSWIGGSKGTKYIDFSPLKGRKVLLCPDVDKIGINAMYEIYNKLKKIGCNVRIVLPPKNTPQGWDIADAVEDGWDQKRIIKFMTDYLVNPAEKNTLKSGSNEIGDDVPYFWYIRRNDKNKAELKISYRKLISFLEYFGYCKMYIKNTNTSIFLRITENIAEEVTPEMIKDFTNSYVKNSPEQLPNTDDYNFTRNDLLEVLTRGANLYFGRDKLELLSVVQPKFHRDDKYIAHLYFLNGYVIITKDKKEFQSYSNLKSVIWKKQIIQRDYCYRDENENGEFFKLISKICNDDENRINALRSAFGYLLHRYKNKSLACAIIFVDEKISDDPEGRSCKSLVADAIGYTRNISIIDGKQFKFDTQFAFQTVHLDTELLVFDDVTSIFDFEIMFHMVTSGLEIEKKNKPRITLDFEDSPKYLITTNYMIESTGGSAEARKAEFEFSPHYNKNHTPHDEFNHNLFDDWEETEWSKFDHFMINCVQLFLKEGLLESPDINRTIRKLLQETSPEFVEFMDDMFKSDGDINSDKLSKSKDKKQLFENFCTEYEDFHKLAGKGKFTQQKFTRMLHKYSIYNGLTYEDTREREGNDIKRCIVFSKKD